MGEVKETWYSGLYASLCCWLARLAIRVCGIPLLYYTDPAGWEAYMSEGGLAQWSACNRCGIPIPSYQAETCWFCEASLCGECWDEYGHCGHPEAEAQNEAARRYYAETAPEHLSHTRCSTCRAEVDEEGRGHWAQCPVVTEPHYQKGV